jgi:hypothetical protein
MIKMSRFKIVDSEPVNTIAANNSPVKFSQEVIGETSIGTSRDEESQREKKEEVKINNVIQLPLIQEPIIENPIDENYPSLVESPVESLSSYENLTGEKEVRHKLFGVSHFSKKKELSDVNLRPTELVQYEKNKKPNYGLLIIGGGAIMSVLTKFL